MENLWENLKEKKNSFSFYNAEKSLGNPEEKSLEKNLKIARNISLID